MWNKPLVLFSFFHLFCSGLQHIYYWVEGSAGGSLHFLAFLKFASFYSENFLVDSVQAGSWDYKSSLVHSFSQIENGDRLVLCWVGSYRNTVGLRFWADLVSALITGCIIIRNAIKTCVLLLFLIIGCLSVDGASASVGSLERPPCLQ